ncbi:hypothetical protein J6590_021145 [Homalodisca vitripennis]|nr:hypothetical protein J6590_021145 [Homalodisca vitripennis]
MTVISEGRARVAELFQAFRRANGPLVVPTMLVNGVHGGSGRRLPTPELRPRPRGEEFSTLRSSSVALANITLPTRSGACMCSHSQGGRRAHACHRGKNRKLRGGFLVALTTTRTASYPWRRQRLRLPFHVAAAAAVP